MIFRKLTKNDANQLFSLIDKIENALVDKNFWLPLNDTAKDHFFDPGWTEFFGFFENGALISAVALFYNEHEFGESADYLKISKEGLAEVGRAMVRPDKRGQGLLLQMLELLKEEARKRNIKTLLATVYPQNLPSKKSFLSAGFTLEDTYTKSCGFERSIFLYSL